VIKSLVGERLDPVVQRLFPFLFWRPLAPNALTLGGVAVSLGAAAAFMSGHAVLGGVGMLAGGFFDLVDGVVARHQGTSTRFGAFLDSTLDRLVDMSLLLGICVRYAAQGEPGHVLLAGAALVAGVLVSYAKARAELVVPRFEVGVFERGERVAVLAAGAILGFLVPALWVVLLGSGVTVAQRIALAYREMERLDAADRVGLGEQTG
jgi:phosphatidylglycerophosphate synthase